MTVAELVPDTKLQLVLFYHKDFSNSTLLTRSGIVDFMTLVEVTKI